MSKTSGARQKSKPGPLPGELRQAVWAEAIATIAGGFAHDANNCLTGIFSMSDLCLAQVDPQNPLHESLSLMRDSASQASQLLQRLTRLIYDQPGTSTFHDLNEITTETADILRRVLPRSLDLRLGLNAEPLPVLVDAVELRRVLICLALNAVEQGSDASTIAIATTLGSEAFPAVTVEVSNATPSLENVKGASKCLQRLNVARVFAEAHGGSLDTHNSKGIVQLCLPRADLS